MTAAADIVLLVVMQVTADVVILVVMQVTAHSVPWVVMQVTATAAAAAYIVPSGSTAIPVG